MRGLSVPHLLFQTIHSFISNFDWSKDIANQWWRFGVHVTPKSCRNSVLGRRFYCLRNMFQVFHLFTVRTFVKIAKKKQHQWYFGLPKSSTYNSWPLQQAYLGYQSNYSYCHLIKIQVRQGHHCHLFVNKNKEVRCHCRYGTTMYQHTSLTCRT